MTTTIIRSYATVFTLALALVAVTPLAASEVTGTLSSDTTSNAQANGNLTGTVTNETNSSGNLTGTVISDSDGSSSGGSRSSGTRTRNGETGNDTPSGAVLGAADDVTTMTPGFPNAGVSPTIGSSTEPSFWSVMLTFVKGIFTF